MSFDYDSLINQYLPVLYTGMVLTLISIIWFEFSSRTKWPVMLLVLGAIVIRLFVTLIDPALHLWDEQFHALVAKNMMSKPFVPVLIPNPVLSFQFQNWTANYIWLHKQPLFLWQIALSMKIFGVNELSVRIPSILMSSLAIVFVYRIGKIMYNKYAGFIAALLYSGSTFIIELTAGRIPTDHNDVAFLFYVTASIWAWFEYEHSRTKYWIWAVGIFSGLAILVKWLPGLLVYLGWFSTMLFQSKKKKIESFKNLGKSLLLTMVIALPWQIYGAIRFPDEYFYELKLNSLHFYKVIEGHSGSVLFYFKNIPTIYGADFWYIILGGFIIFFFVNIKSVYKIFSLTVILFTYLFYSLADTKLVAYTIIVSPLVYVISGVGITWILTRKLFKKPVVMKNRLLKSLLNITVIIFLFYHFLNHDRLTLQNLNYRKQDNLHEISNTIVYKQLKDLFPDKTVCFNTYQWDYVKIMFYTDGIAYKKTPDQKVIKKLQNENLKVVVFDNGKLPRFILNDKSIAKLKTSIWNDKFGNKLIVYY